MIEKNKDKEREGEEVEKEGKKKSGKRRIKKGSKRDRKRNRRVVFWVLVVTVGVSLIFYLSAWWGERKTGTDLKEENGVEIRGKEENNFIEGWGKSAVYEF